MSETIDAPHPTREEWTARQASMPKGMRELIDQHARLLAERNERERSVEEARHAALMGRLGGFELALKHFLSGAEWLYGYRVKNPLWAQKYPFTLEHDSWAAEFDLSRVGGWRLMAYLVRNDVGCWVPAPQPWAVITPRDSSVFAAMPEALHYAAQYVGTPF